MHYNDLIKKVRHLEIKAKGLSQQILSGKYQSRFRGRGMAFSEVRSYQIGDDIRDIDWNVTARHSNPYVKIYEEEREQTVMLLVDMSASNDWGTGDDTKKELIIEIAATLAFSAIQNNDKVGAIIFTDKIEKFIAARSGKKHILSIISELLSFETKGQQTDIKLPLDFLLQTIKKRATVFLLSDFIKDASTFNKSLLMASRKHDLISLRIEDKRERELPNMELIRIEDSETRERFWIDSSSKKIRAKYNAAVSDRLDTYDKLCKSNSIDNVPIIVGEDYVNRLIQLFKRRA